MNLQYYYYIHHQHIDPDADGEVSAALGTTKLSTSKNVVGLGLAQQEREIAIQRAAEQQRLYMTVYVLSFLSNTLMNILSDHMTAVVDEKTGEPTPPSDFNLAMQVTQQ